MDGIWKAVALLGGGAALALALLNGWYRRHNRHGAASQAGPQKLRGAGNLSGRRSTSCLRTASSIRRARCCIVSPR